MKRNNQHPALSRVRSLFSSLMLATVLALSLGSCSEKSADEVKPTAKVASTKANAAASHQLLVYVPSAMIRYVGVVVGSRYFINVCASAGKVGWLDMKMQVFEGQKITVYGFMGNNVCGSGPVHSYKTRIAPGRDGYTNWWFQWQ